VTLRQVRNLAAEANYNNDSSRKASSSMSMLSNVVRRVFRRAKYDRSTCPDAATSRGIDREAWKRTQVEHELDYWNRVYPAEVGQTHDPAAQYRERYWPLNKSMFRDCSFSFADRVVLDIGCGPFGSMDLSPARRFIGLDPLADEYQSTYGADARMTILAAEAESIPLPDQSVDTVVCVNALDHFHQPYRALDEMVRVLRRGGEILLATDVGGTPRHPCNIQEAELSAWIGARRLRVLHIDCGTHLPSSWPAGTEIPLFVLHAQRPEIDGASGSAGTR
jgi:SAM-dependent methyltransferase